MTAIALWLNETFYGFDAAIFAFFHNLAKGAGAFFTPFFNFITFLGEEGWIFILAGVLLLLFAKTRKMGVSMLIALLFGLFITNLALKNFVARPRPFIMDETFKSYWEFVGKTKVGDMSFPSGHTTSAMAAGFAFFLFGNKKWSWSGIAFALLMGASRIYLAVHYATDVIGGVISGMVAGFLAFLLVQFIFSLFEKHAGNRACNFILDADILNLFKKKEL